MYSKVNAVNLKTCYFDLTWSKWNSICLENGCLAHGGNPVQCGIFFYIAYSGYFMSYSIQVYKCTYALCFFEDLTWLLISQAHNLFCLAYW